MTDKVTLDRRSVLKSTGGLAAAAATGALATGSALGAHDDQGTAVRVNQTGYWTSGHKLALVTSEMADVANLSSFEVVDADSGETVTSGSLSSAMTDTVGNSDDNGDGTLQPSEKEATNQTVKQADFSDLTTAGTYKVVVGDHESRPFEVGSSTAVYGDLLADVGRLYTLKRANARIVDEETGLDIGPGHPQDAEAVVAEPTTGDWLSGYSAGDTIDVTGGWYDAGDYGKYVVTTAVTAAQLMLAYERNPKAFDTGQFDMPESLDDPDVGTMPDVLAEVKYGMEFLSKMQRPNGALFFKVAGDHWPKMETSPAQDDMTRYVFGTSSAGTAMGVGAYAMAARVFRDHDAAFADEMLRQAKKGFQWLQDNPGVVWEKSKNQNKGSGRYNRASSDSAERYWAAAELLRTTGDSTYDDYIQNDLPKYEKVDGTTVSLPAKVRAPVDWNGTVSLGHYAYANAGGAEEKTARVALQKAVWVGQRYMPSHERGIDPYTTGLYSYYWGDVKSGVQRAVQCQWGIDVSTVSYVSPDAEIAQWAMEPLHHALGRSATGYSYVTGYGELSTEKPHDRIIQSQDLAKPMPGMLVGGPHNKLWKENGEPEYGTSLVDHVSKDTPHALSYRDAHDAYPVNEWAINYTAPLFAALAELPGMRPGGDEKEGKLQKPALSVSSTSADSITVSWNAVSAASSYEVSVDGEQTRTLDAGTTSVTIEGLEPDTKYTVGITAVGDSGSKTGTITATTAPDGAAGLDLALQAEEVGDGDQTTASITLAEAPNGLSGYELKVSVADPSIATITGVTYPDSLSPVGSTDDVSADGSTATLKAADLQKNVEPGATDVTLASLTLEGKAQGSTDVAVAVKAIDDDSGGAISVSGATATLTVTTLEPIVEGKVPQNVDSDPAYEDLNANGKVDYDDVVIYFNHMQDAAMTDHVDAYDLNDNGEIDFDDVVSLFEEVN